MTVPIGAGRSKSRRAFHNAVTAAILDAIALARVSIALVMSPVPIALHCIASCTRTLSAASASGWLLFQIAKAGLNGSDKAFLDDLRRKAVKRALKWIAGVGVLAIDP